MQRAALATALLPAVLLSTALYGETIVRFVYKDASANQVELVGSFNDGQALPMNRTKAGWAANAKLEEGTYTYFFKVDGESLPDPVNPKRNVKPGGFIESVLDVGEGDYPVPLSERGDQPDDLDELVVVTLNTHSFQEKTKRFKKLEWIARGLAALNADVVGLNEILFGEVYNQGYQGVYYDTSEIIKAHLEQRTGQTYHLYKKPFGRWGDGENLANAILSRYPLLETDAVELTTTDKWPAPDGKRNCLLATVEIPRGGPVNFFFTHTMGWDSSDTAEQIGEIKDFVERHSAPGVRAEFIVGDLNVWPTHPSYPHWLVDEPACKDLFDDRNPNVPGTEERMVDHILLTTRSPLASRTSSSAVIFNDAKVDGVFYPRVSDHVGLVARFDLK